MSGTNTQGAPPRPRRTYHITGNVAQARIEPLLREDPTTEWVAYDSGSTAAADFLWENAPRKDTKAWRDHVLCYSHLPNGTNILDSKWVLGRLLGRNTTTTSATNDGGALALLETHCFRGKSGYAAFLETVGLSSFDSESPSSMVNDTGEMEPAFRDLMEELDDSFCNSKASSSPNLWVIKDAHCNGAGGIWVLGSANAAILSQNLTEEHAYVAQRYVHPPVLFRQRKCHVRVYALLTCDGRIYCHRRCFLHVANERFTTQTHGTAYPNAIHITNCCANSHDTDKFAGEICADLTATAHHVVSAKDHDMTVGLAAFAPSIHASIAKLAQETGPFLLGGERHGGFEYLGLDFMLSHRGGESSVEQPIAYLLEVNAPPSQDTATKLPHAEALHNDVMRDLLTLWVYPQVTGARAIPGGWQCVHGTAPDHANLDSRQDAIVPSKAAILNKIRWNLFERKRQKASLRSDRTTTAVSWSATNTDMAFAQYARSFFPYFPCDDDGIAQATRAPHVFLENAGGTQVPAAVIAGVSRSLEQRNRSVLGARSALAAKEILATLLGATCRYTLWLGANATTLLDTLAHWYVHSGNLQLGDEILLLTENHQAHVQPWLHVAKQVGARILWCDAWSSLEALLSPKTRIVAVSHASNMLGQVNDAVGPRLRAMVDARTNGYAHVVVDGVAYVPHRYAGLDELGVDWYVVSCHKWFGPHLGVLCGRQSLLDHISTAPPPLQLGTVNYESCEGIRGLGCYFAALAAFDPSQRGGTVGTEPSGDGTVLDKDQVVRAYQHIQSVEWALVEQLLKGLRRWKEVRVIDSEDLSLDTEDMRLPTVCFVHATISSRSIVEYCYQGGVACRNGTFLSTDRFQKAHGIIGDSPMEGVVRFSMAHYNTRSEIALALHVLESIPGWAANER